MLESLSVMDLIANVGFPMAMVVYLLLRDKARDKVTDERERRLGDRIDKVEDDRRKDLLGTVAAATDAINNSTRVCTEVIKVNRNLYTCVAALTTVIQNAPCANGFPPPQVDPEIYAAAQAYQRIRTPHTYEPHPSAITADPGEPPKTPEPIRRPRISDDDDTHLLPPR